MQQCQTPHGFQTEKSQISAACFESELHACCRWFPLSPTPQHIPSLANSSPFTRGRVGANTIQFPGWFNLLLFLHYGTYLCSMQQPNEDIFSKGYFLMAFGERFVSNVTWIVNKNPLNTLPWLYFPLFFSSLYLFQSVFSLTESTEKLLSKECFCLLILSNMFISLLLSDLDQILAPGAIPPPLTFVYNSESGKFLAPHRLATVCRAPAFHGSGL